MSSFLIDIEEIESALRQLRQYFQVEKMHQAGELSQVEVNIVLKPESASQLARLLKRLTIERQSAIIPPHKQEVKADTGPPMTHKP